VFAFVAAAALGTSWVACRPEPKPPTRFSLGDPLELGMFTLKARRMETVASPPPVPLGSLSAQPGEKVIAVFVRWDGLDGLTPMDRRIFVESFLQHRLAVVDEADERTPAFHAMSAGLYHGMPGGLPEREWVVVFHVWVDSREFTLLVEHPDPDPTGFELAAIPLTR
jgi:hypothetical protein